MILIWILVSTFIVSAISLIGIVTFAVKDKILERILFLLVGFSAWGIDRRRIFASYTREFGARGAADGILLYHFGFLLVFPFGEIPVLAPLPRRDL